MKGFMLAAAACLAFGALCAILLRLSRGKHVFARFVAGALACAAAYVLAHLATSDDVGFLPGEWVERCAPLDLANGLVVFLILAATFVNVLYATVLAGLSTTVLVLLEREGSLTREDLLARHGLGDGRDPAVAHRISMLLAGRHIEPHGGGYRLLPKGRRVAALTRALRFLVSGRALGG